MRISSYNSVAGKNDTVVRQYDMLYAHLPSSEFIVMADVLFVSKLSHLAAERGGLYILIWCEMILNQTYPVTVKNRIHTEFSEYLYCRRNSHIITKAAVKLCFYQFSRPDGFQTGMIGQNLLSHCHAHKRTSANKIYKYRILLAKSFL